MTLRQFDRYETLRVLGEGAMGRVYEGRDPRLLRRVAIKTIKPEIVQRDPAFMARFQREARTVAALNHPGIVAIYDCDADYLVMEFIEGRELKALMGHGPQPPARIAALLVQIAAALDFAHDHAIIHRDIKPANILVTDDGRAKITDFGIAKMDSGAAVSGLTHTGQVLGTPAYMSPEQVAGKPLDRRSDQFSLAVVIYQLLTGEPPFTGDSIATLVYKIVAERHRPVRELNGNLPPGLDAVMDRALAKSPADRFADCGGFSRAFAAALEARAAGGNLPAPPLAATLSLPQPVAASTAASAAASERRPRPAPRPVRPAPAPIAPPSAAAAANVQPKKPAMGLGIALVSVLLLLAAGGVAARHWLRQRQTGTPGTAAPPDAPAAALNPRRTPREIAPTASPAQKPAAARGSLPEAGLPPQPRGARELRTAPASSTPEISAAAPSEPAPAASAVAYQPREFKLGKRPGEPVSLCTTAQGFMVADSDDRKLLIFGADGALLETLPRGASAGPLRLRLFRRRRSAPESESPAGAAPFAALQRPLAAAAAGEKLFVVDEALHALLIFDEAGQELARAGNFEDPRLVAARSGEALVWDKEKDAVIAVDAAGGRHRSIANARSLQALAFAGGRALAGNSDGLWIESGGQFIPLLNEGEARIASAAAIIPFHGGFAVADPDQRRIHFLSGALKPAGGLDLKPLGVDSPRLLLARGDSLWVLHEHTKMTVLTPSP